MTFGRRDDRFSILGALRPGTGQAVTRAVVTTYSLDLVALLGLVLALGGDAEAEFEASPLGLVKAFERMRESFSCCINSAASWHPARTGRCSR